MKDPICKREGCYMFAPGTPERAGCEKDCRLQSSHLAAANDPFVSGRLYATRKPELQFIPSTSYDDAVAAVLREKLPKVISCMGVVHDSVMCEFDEGVFDSPDYAALEMRVMAALTNKKGGE